MTESHVALDESEAERLCAIERDRLSCFDGHAAGDDVVRRVERELKRHVKGLNRIEQIDLERLAINPCITECERMQPFRLGMTLQRRFRIDEVAERGELVSGHPFRCLERRMQHARVR